MGTLIGGAGADSIVFSGIAGASADGICDRNLERERLHPVEHGRDFVLCWCR